MVKPPYVAYVKPTGIKFIALDKQNKHKIIDVTQKIVGKILVNPFVVFKKPFEQIPSIIAKKR
jgi:hypothetical protein